MSKVDNATKKKLLEAAASKLKKQFGDEVILDTTENLVIEAIPTGSMIIDWATGVGGVPRARITEIAGDSGSGKSSICYSLCAQAQKKYPDEMILYVDIEQAVSIPYMEAFGVDTSPDKFIFVQPDTIEEALEIMDTYISTGLFSLVILDSIGAALTQKQAENGYDSNTIADLAKRMTVGGNKIKTAAYKANTAVVYVNQVYSAMSLYASNATVTKGGKAVPYQASIRIQLYKRDLIEDEDNKETIKGQMIRAKFIKNKIGSPYKDVETKLLFGQGFDYNLEVLDVAIEQDIVHKGGAWYSWESSEGKELKFQGKDKAFQFLQNNEVEFKHLEEKVVASFGK